MKKFFLLTAICLMALASVASAQPNYNFVRVSDLGAQAFVDRMGYGNIYQNLKQNIKLQTDLILVANSG